MDFLAAQFDGPIIVFGMCSGAYHAFQAALIDHRISGLILVNLQKFVWHEGEQQIYLRNLAKLTMWRRLVADRSMSAALPERLPGVWRDSLPPRQIPLLRQSAAKRRWEWCAASLRNCQGALCRSSIC